MNKKHSENADTSTYLIIVYTKMTQKDIRNQCSLNYMTYIYSIINASLWIVVYFGAQRYCLQQGAVAEQKV